MTGKKHEKYLKAALFNNIHIGGKMRTKLLIEQHFHGCFGIDFNTASVDDVLYLSKEILRYGVGGIFPTIVTDSVENTKRQIKIIKEAAEKQTSDMAKIFGIHIEGIFINPAKKGIHNEKHLLAPTVDNFKLIEDDFIKIQTLAPELDKNFELSKYLKSKEIKVQAGHCTGSDLSSCDGVTHLFNAMEGISHKHGSTTLSALISDNLYTEVIADGIHICDDALKLIFKTKPTDKIILVSDCLPITKSHLEDMVFADEKIFYDGKKATSKEGVLAGSTVLLHKIIRMLNEKGLFNPQLIENPYNYHNINLDGYVEFDEEYNIIKVEK